MKVISIAALFTAPAAVSGAAYEIKTYGTAAVRCCTVFYNIVRASRAPRRRAAAPRRAAASFLDREGRATGIGVRARLLRRTGPHSGGFTRCATLVSRMTMTRAPHASGDSYLPIGCSLVGSP